MTLEKCYIAGFGRLADRSFTFTDGLNQIMEENGRGKTTFAVFIKAMFYGMEYAPRRSGLTEREHYRPWNTQSYGGSLTFSIGKKRYRIERQFGNSDKDDTFELFDEESGMPSDDFTEKVGEELFEVDRESFEKSIFVPQGSLETEITSRLNAKLGGLGAVQDDMNRFDQAVSAIDEARKKYTATSKVNPGKIKLLQEQIKAQKEKADQIATLQKAYDAKAQMLMEKRAQLRKLEFRKSQLSDSLTSIARSEKSVGAYQAKKDSLDKQEEVLKGLDDFFASGLPDSSEIDDLENRERELELIRSRRDMLKEKIPEPEEQDFLKQLFSDNTLDNSDIEDWKKKASDIKALRMKGEHVQMSEDERGQLSELREFFKAGEPTDDQMQQELVQISRLNEINGQMKSLGETFQKHKDALKSSRQLSQLEEGLSGLVITGLIAVVLIVAGTLFFGLAGDGKMAVILGIVSEAAGVAFFAAFVAQIIHRRRRHKKELASEQGEIYESEKDLGKLREEYDRLDEEVSSFIGKYPVEAEDRQQAILEIHRKKDRYDTLAGEEKKFTDNTSGMMEELSSLQLSLYTSLEKYARLFGVNLYEDANVEELISQINDRYDEYQEFEKNEQEYERIVGEINGRTRGLMTVLKSFPLKSDITDLAACIREIRANAFSYTQTQTQIDSLKEELKSLHVDEIANNGMDLHDLQFEQKKLDEDISKQKQYIADDSKELEARSAVLLECEEAKENLKDLNAKKEEYDRKVRLLEETKKYLTIAKENFLKVYMGPLRDQLTHYLKMIYPDTDEAILTDDFELDMNLSVTVSGHSGGGRTRSMDYLSTGYQDLASFSSRAALIDVLFRREQPMIILDDPFVNFDAPKLADVKTMVAALSQKYQIIYFTCHESRSMK